MTKTRDMTQKEFDEACQRHGFHPGGTMGFYHHKTGGVSVWNVGRNATRRQKLAYLIREFGKMEQDAERRAATKRLNDAAPELLAALQHVLTALDREHPHDWGQGDIDETERKVKAAIAKATGETT